MSAIRNIGELASPYFLLDVWARRDEIEIDPETYASLKRKARILVRDWRAFELRAEDPDAAWYERRWDLLGVSEAARRRVTIESDHERELLLWSDPSGSEALLIGDVVGTQDPDQRVAGEDDPPSTLFELALDAYDGAADWGLLLAGTRVRVYRRSSGISQQYVELDLETVVDLDDELTWRTFAAIFRAPGYALDGEGVPLIQRVVDESRRHASRLATDMRKQVVFAAETLIQGALDAPENAGLFDDPSREELHALFEQTLYYLYRVLFVLFAEAQEVLPISGPTPYRTTYSADHLIELARSGSAAPGGTYYGSALRTLFKLLWEGPPAHARALGFDPVGGELFDPARTASLDAAVIPDPAWAAALRAIAVATQGGTRWSFLDLGVDQLGSIYEGLLQLEPHLVRGDRILADVDGEPRVLEPSMADDLRVLRQLRAGDFVLESTSGRRKGSGSYYTPVEITSYLTQATLQPLVDPIVDRSTSDPAAAERELLALRICDPAMGSGAFLVQATRVLALGLARIRAARRDGRVTPDLIHEAKRVVARECVYGVDLNPMAVTLAKVSLWLETLEPGKPLSFLDAHLRCGDSLVGVTFTDAAGELSLTELATWPANAAKGLQAYLRKEAGERGERPLERLRGRRAPRAARQAPLPGIEAAAIREGIGGIAAEREALVARQAEHETLDDALAAQEAFRAFEAERSSLWSRLRHAADFWCAQWFCAGEDAPCDGDGPVAPAIVGDFEEIVGRLLSGRALTASFEVQLDAALRVSERRRFFHWALEFPEVIVERGGFDAVIGNPPWNTLSPDVKEFFSTYDPHSFRRGVPKGQQEERKRELRDSDADIDRAWREEARYLHELSNYAKPESGRFAWYAPDGQLRKGDANVFRLFVERAYRLLRPGGRLGQVLPESVYVSSPATGVRQGLLTEGQLERLYVFENRRGIFPIDSRIKIVLLTAQRDGRPTEQVRARFFVGKDAAGRDRTVSLEDLPAVLADLERSSPTLSVAQIRALAPQTWSFPELQTALDVEIAAHCAAAVPPLNLDEQGWNLTYCRELDADRDASRFHEASDIEARGAVRRGQRWVEPNGVEWWPLVEGFLFYHLEFPVEDKEPRYWVRGDEVRAIEGRLNDDGSSVMDHYRVAWRDVASATNERSAIAAVLPPCTAAKDKAPTVWGGLLGPDETVTLAAVMSSFCFDYLVRFKGATSLKYGIVNPVPAPTLASALSIVRPAAEVICQSPEFSDLWTLVAGGESLPELDSWEIAERRARIDAEVALAYALSPVQFAALLSTFPNIDRSQPMLAGEPKCFVTRDLALLAYARLTGADSADIHELLSAAGVDLPPPRPEHRDLATRVELYRVLGASPYRPSPRGARTPTDPELLASVREMLSEDPMTAAEIAGALDEDEDVVRKVLKELTAEPDVYADGRGKRRRYYVVEDE